MSDDYSLHYPQITSGSNVAVETTPEGYRINLVPPAVPVYNGFFLVRPYPTYLGQSPIRAVQIVNGLLPYEEAIEKSAGYVLIDRIYYVSEDDGGPLIESWRLPVAIPSATSLSVEKSATIYLQIAAFHYKGAANYFPEADGSYVTFLSDYMVLTQKPEPRLGTIYLPLAEIEFDEACETFAITQLSWGVPCGTIARYSKTGPKASE